MFKKLLFTSFLLLNFFSIIHPSQKENTKLFDYCHSLEKILSRNTIQKRRNASQKVMAISKDILKFGVNKVYCFLGYWIETANPGTFESILLEKTKKVMNEFNELKDFKDEVDGILNDINSEYKVIKKEFNSLF